MNRRSLLTLCAAMPFVPLADAMAQKRDRDVYRSMRRWLAQLYEPLNVLADKADRQKLVEHLTDLGGGLYVLLREKYEVAELCRRGTSGVTDDAQWWRMDIERHARAVIVRAEAGRGDLRRAAGLLTQKYKDQGDAIADDLQKALTDPQSWLSSLLSARDLSTDQLLAIADKVRRSADALYSTNEELGTLVGHLMGRRSDQVRRDWSPLAIGL